MIRVNDENAKMIPRQIIRPMENSRKTRSPAKGPGEKTRSLAKAPGRKCPRPRAPVAKEVLSCRC